MPKNHAVQRFVLIADLRDPAPAMNKAPQITPPPNFSWKNIGSDIAGLRGWALEHSSGRRYWLRASDDRLACRAYFSDGAQEAMACIALAAERDRAAA